MTMMLLALAFSDAALAKGGVTEYRLTVELPPSGQSSAEGRAWTPGIDGWKPEKVDCPVFFQREIKEFGMFRVGPKCTQEEIPYAL